MTSTKEEGQDNTLLAALGNSLLGLYASEQLATVYPNLPTRALKALVSLHVGPNACFDVARDLGLGVANAPFATDGTVRGDGFAGKARKRSTAGAGVPVRWVRGEGVRSTWEEVVARSVRAFVGLVYQEKVRILGFAEGLVLTRAGYRCREEIRACAFHVATS